MKALLVLEDGFWLEGKAFAGSGEAYGEVVFNTSMSGYQEIITDPSYKGQIVTFTYPLIGNYGANEADSESARPQVEAVIVREYSRFPSNWRATRTLVDYLDTNGVLGIEDVDTRALTRHVREAGAMRGVVSTTDLDRESLLRKVRAHPGLVGQDMVRRVTCAQEYTWNASGEWRVVAFDFGIKRSILRMLEEAGCQVTVVPAYTPAKEVLAKDPDGVFLSNGPGDPAGVPGVVREVGRLIGRKPVFGICLGHQILGLALGLSTFKLKFGHRGANHPVKNLHTGRVEITSQNHGFCVCVDAVESVSSRHADRTPPGTAPLEPGSPGAVPRDVMDTFRVTHVNLNDGTVEGMEVPGLMCFSVQYHPEASPGPHDSRYLFERFVHMMAGKDAGGRQATVGMPGASGGRGAA
ncbi:MAG: glutamine-hydrolyzing carbamoyl-phosphate synthase small subunit [Firmicutes bacterium]|nr:glutamine-hydrolyzing carbamoyl-phosphate synthase small subunit [Bacillota bacterium]MDH7496401.1 glutamine-hydrolyzing carbamoyl-phosphate synthase small subunit [Bacillota bacterium]